MIEKVPADDITLYNPLCGLLQEFSVPLERTARLSAPAWSRYGEAARVGWCEACSQCVHMVDLFFRHAGAFFGEVCIGVGERNQLPLACPYLDRWASQHMSAWLAYLCMALPTPHGGD